MIQRALSFSFLLSFFIKNEFIRIKSFRKVMFL
jgi:hypothetical protein